MADRRSRVTDAVPPPCPCHPRRLMPRNHACSGARPIRQVRPGCPVGFPEWSATGRVAHFAAPRSVGMDADSKVDPSFVEGVDQTSDLASGPRRTAFGKPTRVVNDAGPPKGSYAATGKGPSEVVVDDAGHRVRVRRCSTNRSAGAATWEFLRSIRCAKATTYDQLLGRLSPTERRSARGLGTSGCRKAIAALDAVFVF
jgi:hypothetical protein